MENASKSNKFVKLDFIYVPSYEYSYKFLDVLEKVLKRLDYSI